MNANSKCIIKIDGTAYETTLSSATVISQTPVTLMTTTQTISHENNGTKSIYVEAGIYDETLHDYLSSPSFNGFTVTLTTVARQATIISANDFTDEQDITIKYNNPAGDLVTSLTLTLKVVNTVIASITLPIDKNTITWSLSASVRSRLRAETPNNNELSVKLILESVSQGVTFESEKTLTMTIVDANPVISGVSYYDSDSSIVAITTDNTKIVRNKSTLVLSFSAITARKSATLRSVVVTINGIEHRRTLSGAIETNKTLTWGLLNEASDALATIVVTDSRGNTQMSFLTISVYDYHTPINLSKAVRQSNFYDTTDITANVQYSSLGGHNTISITWACKLTTASSWTDMGSIANNTTTTINLVNTKAYQVKFIATDLLESSTIIRNVPVGIPLLFFDTENNFVGLHCMPKRWLCSGKPLSMLSDNGNVTLTVNASGIQTFTDVSSNQNLKANFGGTTSGYLQLFASSNTATIIETGDSGQIVCVSLVQTSSRKVKENIKTLTLLEAQKVLELEPVTFDFKDKAQGTDHRGFVAEDVAEVIPELVSPETENSPASLNYAEIIPYLLRVMQDQEKRITALENRLKELEGS